MASATLSSLETELTAALEECIDAHFEDSESRFAVLSVVEGYSYSI